MRIEVTGAARGKLGAASAAVSLARDDIRRVGGVIPNVAGGASDAARGCAEARPRGGEAPAVAGMPVTTPAGA